MRTTSLNDGAGFSKRLFGNLEDAARLSGGVFILGADRAGSGKMHGVPHAHRAGEADDGLVGRTAADVLRMVFHQKSETSDQ